jgi:transposase
MTDDFMLPPDSTITPDEWQQTPASVRAWIGELIAEVRELREMVEQLREVVNRNSQNSSQPPSQDRPDQKPTREPSGRPRKRGGQPGHPGHHRALVEEVDEVIVYKPICCEQCGALLLGEDPAPSRHQVTELPIVKPTVTEYQVHELTCPGCGQRTRGKLPPEIAASQFGSNVISLVGYVMGRFRLSKRQAANLLAECFAIPLAVGTVVNQQQLLSAALAAPVAELVVDRGHGSGNLVSHRAQPQWSDCQGVVGRQLRRCRRYRPVQCLHLADLPAVLLEPLAA